MTKQSDGVASAWSTVEEIQMSFSNVSWFLTALSFQVCVVQNSTVFPSIKLELLICGSWTTIERFRHDHVSSSLFFCDF